MIIFHLKVVMVLFIGFSFVDVGYFFMFQVVVTCYAQFSISSLEMCVDCFINAIFSLSIFELAHRHANHSIILSITLFHYVPHVLISSKCRKGFSLVWSFGYSNDFFVISWTLPSMFDINVYSIINSKMFGVTFGVNFLLSIIE
jgi:hypothetical protein